MEQLEPRLSAEALAMFRTWAPRESQWSAWAKPIVFTQSVVSSQQEPVPSPPTLHVDALPDANERLALIVDLPGPVSVQCAVQLAAHGYQPVPLFNATVGTGYRNLVDVPSVARSLWLYAEGLKACKVPPDAPPVFMLDSLRHSGTPDSDVYDNRWLVFPQDFPSARMLQKAAISRVIVVVQHGRIRHDLRTTIRNWRADGLAVSAFDPCTATHIGLDFEMSWIARLRDHLNLLFHGFKASSAGGFGGVIPDTSANSGFA